MGFVGKGLGAPCRRCTSLPIGLRANAMHKHQQFIAVVALDIDSTPRSNAVRRAQ